MKLGTFVLHTLNDGFLEDAADQLDPLSHYERDIAASHIFFRKQTFQKKVLTRKKKFYSRK